MVVKEGEESGTKHRLVLELGRGGMGTVFLAVAQGPGGFSKLKVVKRLNAELATETAFLKMFLDEAKLLARLNHPNIVQANEVGFDGQEYFIEMEYLEGQPYEFLLRRTAATGGLPLATHLFILSQVLAGLHYAHELTDHDGTPLDVVHRDVSPHNVFITYDGAVKLLDFGIAKAIGASSVTRTGIIKGKLTYMPPEQAAHGEIDRRTDIFPVGVMLWQALTGKRLWQGLGDLQILARLHEGDIARARSVDPAVSEVFDEICAKAMAPRRDDRYATAEKMQDDLEASLESTGERVGPKAIGRLMCELFAEQRLRIRKEIEKHVGREAEPAGPVPMLRVEGYGRASSSAIEEVATMADRASLRPPSSSASSELPRPSNAPRSSVRSPAMSLPRPLSVGRRLLPGLLALGVLVVAAGAWRGLRDQTTPETRAATRPCTGAMDCQGWAPRALCSEGGTCFAAPECVTNQECIDAHGGAPFQCRKNDGRCVDLHLHGCEPHGEAAAYGRDDLALFGVLLPASGPGAARGKVEVRSIELARREFARAAEGTAPDPRLRPLALVVCDDASDADEKARYLAEDVRVSAVIGFGPSDAAIDLARSEFLPHHILSVVADGVNPLAMPAAPPDGSAQLLWRTMPSALVTAPAVSAVVRDIEESALRSSGQLARGEAVRVALLRRATKSGDAYASAIYSSLTFNGKSAVDNDANFLEVAFGDPTSGGAAPNYDRTIHDVLEFRPHLVLLFGGSEIGTVLVPAIEAKWPSSSMRPLYVAEGGLQQNQLLAFVDQDRRRARRVLGVDVSSASPAGAALVERYNEVYSSNLSADEAQGTEDCGHATCTGAAYDAFYLLGYAAAAAGEHASPLGPLSGEALAHGMSRLFLPAPPIDVGPLQIGEAIADLRSGGGIDLNGAMGRVGPSGTTRELRSPVIVTCAQVDRAGHPMREVDSGLVYSLETKTARGLDRCLR